MYSGLFSVTSLYVKISKNILFEHNILTIIIIGRLRIYINTWLSYLTDRLTCIGKWRQEVHSDFCVPILGADF